MIEELEQGCEIELTSILQYSNHIFNPMLPYRCSRVSLFIKTPLYKLELISFATAFISTLFNQAGYL